MIPRRHILGAGGIALLIGLILSGINLYWGELNQDEGWYLYSAQLVAEGEHPYADFAFTQGPLFPAVYALLHDAYAAFGVLGGRVVTGLFGWAAILLATGLAARLAPIGWRGAAACMTFTLLCVNVYHSYFSLVVKTYALCAFFLAAGLLLYAYADHRRGRMALAGAGLLLAFAAGVRLSVGLFLPVIGLYLLWRHRAWPRAWLYFGLGGMLGLAIAFLPSWLRAPEITRFWLIDFHTAREAGAGWMALVYKGGFLSRWVQAYFVLIVAGGACVFAWLTQPARSAERPSLWPPLWAGVIGMTLLHLSAPFPYEDYQTPIMPLFAALTGAGLTVFFARWKMERMQGALVGSVLLISAAAAFSSPMNQQWVLRERDRIWWRLKDQSDLAVLQDAGRWLREHSEPGSLLLTQDAYLAVESGLRLPRGLEMGPFSYYPDWTRAQAEQRHVMNRERMIALLETTDAPWAAISGYGLAIGSPGVTELPAEETATFRAIIDQRYKPERVIDHFGQAHTSLILLKKR